MNYINDDYFLGHLLKQAKLTNINKLTIDVLKNIAEPKELLTTSILSSIEYWIKWFPTLVENSGLTMTYISSAVMTIEFELDKTRPYSIIKNVFESPYDCEMIIIDDLGKEYKYSILVGGFLKHKKRFKLSIVFHGRQSVLINAFIHLH